MYAATTLIIHKNKLKVSSSGNHLSDSGKGKDILGLVGSKSEAWRKCSHGNYSSVVNMTIGPMVQIYPSQTCRLPRLSQ